MTPQEVELKKRELELKEREMTQSKWSGPVTVAIIAGIVGIVGTFVTSALNRDLERTKYKGSAELERQKQEGSLIVEAIKTGGATEEKEKLAAANLVFLADAGLVTINEPKLTELRIKAGSAIPSLPAPLPGVEFKRSSALTAEMQSKLQSALADYQAALAKLGYDPGQAKDRVIVRVDEDARDNAYFDNESVVIGSNLARDPEYVLSEYTWYVLKQSNPRAFQEFWNSQAAQMAGFGQGLKFFLTCNYLNTPYVGKNYYSLLQGTAVHRSPAYLFNLKELRAFDANAGSDALEPHKLGEIWGGAFWELREKFDRAKVGRLAFQAWKQFQPVKAELDKPKHYVDVVVAAGASPDVALDPQVIRQAFERRKLK